MISSTGTGDGPSNSSIAASASSPFDCSGARSKMRGRRARATRSGRARLDHVRGVLDQRRAVADQLVAALRARVERRAGHRHHLAARLGGQPRGDQRARARRRLDHHRPRASPAMIRLRQGKWRARGSVPGGCSATSSPRSHMRLLPRLVLRRIGDVDAAGDDADRAAFQRAVVRGAVDAAGEARDDDQALLAEVVRQPAGEAAGRRRGVARADDRDGLPVEQVEVALGDQERRRIFELGEQARIEPLAEQQIARAELRDPARSRARPRRGRTAPAPGRRRAGRGRARRRARAAAVPKRASSWR